MEGVVVRKVVLRGQMVGEAKAGVLRFVVIVRGMGGFREDAKNLGRRGEDLRGKGELKENKSL